MTRSDHKETHQQTELQQPDGLDATRKIMEQMGGENGMLGPVVRALNKLLEDPVLRQSMAVPPSDQKLQ